MSLPFIFEDKLDIICFEPLTYNYDKLSFEINNAQVDTNYLKLGSQMRKGCQNFSKTNENAGFASIDNFLSTKICQLKKLNSIQ